jgi:hypothetical protein
MPLWPFKKRRSAPPNKDTPAPPPTERSDDIINNNIHDYTTPAHRPSTAITQRIRRASQQTEKVADAETPAPQQLQRHATSTPDEKHTDHSTAQTRGSVEEDITALPVSRNLERSPHLRPIDTGRPQIPYNFRDHSTLQTSVPRTDPRPPSRPGTARTKRSAHDTFPVRRHSSKKRKENDRLREEEIRGMSAPINVPKRHGDGVFRRDSKKRRNFSNLKDSNISLPYGESIHSMSTVPEQRGWELGLFDMFSPRPAIRLSGVPQYPAPSPFAQPPPSRHTTGGKEKESADAFKKRTQRIGETADDMDASDLRLLMERDAKRRERRKREQQEKLDRKLKAKAARDRSNSNKKRQEAEEARREQEVRSRVAEERRAREPLAPPTAVHPALRDEPHLGPEEVIGLGIDTEQRPDEHMQHAEDPFRDPSPSPHPEHEQQQTQMRQAEVPGTFTPIETPMEDPIVETAQAVRYSQHTPLMATPPLSPSYNRAPTPSSLLSNTIERQERTASLPESPPGMPALLEERRTSEPQSVESRRTGGWATIFRRGGTKKDVKQAPPSEMSFTNTSRESMSRGPIPAHLMGGDRSPFQRNKTGAPTRTQSKFREDLPEMPVSPPDSRVQSPDVPDLPVGAAAIAATHRGRASPRPIDRLNGHSRSSDVDARGAPRFDTPISPGGRAGLVSASLASVDSEGSWLASGGSLKRGSRSSQLSRSIGSLSKRPQEFVASYEDLGGQDKDAEYISRGDPNTDAQKSQNRRPISTSTITGADEESIYDETPDISGEPSSAPLTMHGSVRRKPTLVHREPIARSREGLFAEYATGEIATIEGGNKDDDLEPVTPGTESQVHRATSVHFGGRGHARKVSAGSAKLLDLPPSRRQSMSPVETKRASSASLSKMA